MKQKPELNVRLMSTNGKQVSLGLNSSVSSEDMGNRTLQTHNRGNYLAMAQPRLCAVCSTVVCHFRNGQNLHTALRHFKMCLFAVQDVVCI